MKWQKEPQHREDKPATYYGIAWHEAVIDFESTMGIRLRAPDASDTDWDQKARILASIVRAVFRTRVVRSQTGATARIEECCSPISSAVIASQLNMPSVRGFNGRPVWADHRTRSLTAIHAIRASAAQQKGKQFTTGRIPDFIGYASNSRKKAKKTLS